VVERDDATPLEGYVWLDVHGQLRHVHSQYLVIEPS
jgi:hypothetical protein